MNVTIRRGTIGDLQAAVALWEQAQSARKGVPFLAPEMLEMETRRLAQERSCFLVATQSDKLVGLALYSPARENSGTGDLIQGLAHVSSVAVKPSHWGRGIGRRLMLGVIDELISHGYSRVQLWTQADNARAIALYAALGFQPTHDEKNFEEEHIRRYVRALDRAQAPIALGDVDDHFDRDGTRGVIVEGITGAGKSQTLKALLSNVDFNQRWAPYDVFREKETFGEFMGELMNNPDDPAERKFRLIQRVVTAAVSRSKKVNPYHFILERAHYSYYALLPDWTLYQAFDDELRSLNSHVFLLWLPREELKGRTLYRADRSRWGADFLAFHGDEASALARFEEVQQLRYDGIKKSRIPHTVIDTSQKDWESYAALIRATIEK